MSHKEWNGRFIGAMNASTIKPDDPKRQQKIEKLINDPNYVFQRKLNGERLLVHKKAVIYNNDDYDDSDLIYEMSATGRNSSKYGPPMMKTDLVPHILKEIEELTNGSIVLDGEVLFVPNQAEMTTQQIKDMEFTEDFWACRDIMAHHVNPAGGVEQQEKDGKLHYFVFDVLAFKGLERVDCTYSERLELLEYIKQYFKNSKYVHIMDVEKSAIGKRALMEYCLSIGLEGVVAKHLGRTYQEGKRPANVWVKIKKFDPADGIIIGYNAAEQYTEVISNGKKIVGEDGKVVTALSRFYLNGWIGAVWLGQFIEDSRITPRQRLMWKEVLKFNDDMFLTHLDIKGPEGHTLMPVAKVSGMKDRQRADISENLSEYLGRVVAFKYFEKTPDAYFHPSFVKFRDDKPPHECIWE